MANRIKGITVEIGGDTTGLDKALKGVNSSISKTQSALNDVNRLLKQFEGMQQIIKQVTGGRKPGFGFGGLGHGRGLRKRKKK